MSSTTTQVNLEVMRSPYKEKQDIFTEDQLVSNEPIAQFHDWFQLASETPGIEDPNIICLATATKEGRPSARMILLKGYGKDGFRFCTNHSSRKGQEIVRIEGKMQLLSDDDSNKYFKDRPVPSQISSSVSPQSQPIPSRDYLETKVKQLEDRVQQEQIELTRPADWGGFILVPESIEFWQGQTSRLHDRIRFRKSTSADCVDGKLLHQGQDGWVYERLAS